MNKTLKRVLTLTLALIMLLSLAVTAFADDGDVYPITGEVTVYRSLKEGKCYFTIPLAYGIQNFTLKRSTVKLSANTCGAVPVRFNKSLGKEARTAYRPEFQDWWSTTTDTSCVYTYTFTTETAGACTIKYKIGDTRYTIKVTVLDYVNPLKSLSFTNFNSGKNYASRFKNGYHCDDLLFKSNVKSSSLKLTAKDGWKILSAEILDYNTLNAQGFSSARKGLSSVSVRWGTFKITHSYRIKVSLYNTKNGGTLNLDFDFVGKNSEMY